MKKTLQSILLLTMTSIPLAAAVEVRTHTYEVGGITFEAYLALPSEREGPLPAILIVHDWLGPRAYFHDMARRIAAERGYAAYVADVYGTDTRPANAREAAAAAGALRAGDRSELHARLGLALGDLRAREGVDPGRIVAIGFCFGGGAVLELARSGADLSGVVSLHGNLDTPAGAQEGRVSAAILVLHGDADPYVPPAQVRAFEEEMRAAKARWELVSFGGAVHSFTDPAAASEGARFDAWANRRAWDMTWSFAETVFSR